MKILMILINSNIPVRKIIKIDQRDPLVVIGPKERDLILVNALIASKAVIFQDPVHKSLAVHLMVNPVVLTEVKRIRQGVVLIVAKMVIFQEIVPKKENSEMIDL